MYDKLSSNVGVREDHVEQLYSMYEHHNHGAPGISFKTFKRLFKHNRRRRRRPQTQDTTGRMAFSLPEIESAAEAARLLSCSMEPPAPI